LQQNANSHNFKRAQNFRHFRTNNYRSYDRRLDPHFDPIEDEKRCAKAYKNYQFANSQTNKFRHHFNSNPFVVNSFDDKKNNVKNLKIAENKPFNVSSDKIRGNFMTNSSAKLSNHTLQKSSPIIFNQSKKFKLTKNSPSVSNFIGAQAFEQKNPKPILIGEGEDYNESKFFSSKAKNCSASAAIANVAPIAPKVPSQKTTKRELKRKSESLKNKKNGIEAKSEIDFDSITILNSEIVTIPHETQQKNVSNKAQKLSNTPVEKTASQKRSKSRREELVVPLKEENVEVSHPSSPLTHTHSHTLSPSAHAPLPLSHTHTSPSLSVAPISPPIHSSDTHTHSVAQKKKNKGGKKVAPKSSLVAETKNDLESNVASSTPCKTDATKEVVNRDKEMEKKEREKMEKEKRESYKEKVLREVKEYFLPPLDCSLSIAQVAREVMKVRAATHLSPSKDSHIRRPNGCPNHSEFGLESKHTSIPFKAKIKKFRLNKKIVHKIYQVHSIQTKVRRNSIVSNLYNKMVDFIRTYLSLAAILSLIFPIPKNVIEGKRLQKTTELAKNLNLKSNCHNAISSHRNLRLKRVNKLKAQTSNEVLHPLLLGHEIKNVSSTFKNQLFTPVTLGKNGCKTFIQLDSGATVNLIDKKMAQQLLENNLVNYFYYNHNTELVDVQQNVIKQTLKPINVTCYFNDVAINICFHVVDKLERPLLGLSTMLNANMSIINNDNNSFLLIGSLNNPQTIIENHKIMEDEILLLDNQKLEYGINKVSCYSALETGDVEISPSSDFTNTCLFIPHQSVKIKNHKAELQIYNLTNQSMNLREKTSIGTFSSLNKTDDFLNDDLIINNSEIEKGGEHLSDDNDNGRFAFPLSEEEARRLLESCEPANLPILENGQEAFINWEEEISKPGIFPPHRLDEFKNFLRKETPGIFSKTEYDVGMLDKRYGMVNSFPLTSDEPVCSKPYKFNAVRMSQMNNTFDRLEKNGLIIKGHSPYATPCLLVPKGDGRIRLVMDFRKLNAQCQNSNQPVPRIDTLMQLIADAKPKIFSTCDISNAFHSLQLGPQAMIQASVVTPTCQYLPTRLIFGYKNSPALFLQALQKVFMELPKDPSNIPYCTFYFDDIVIFSKNEEDHMRHLKNVMSLLHKVGLKIQSTKNHFFQPKIELLGKVITGTTISPQRKHIESLARFPTPTNVKQLQSLLGLVCWSHALIPDYSQTIHPLTKLLKKDEPFIWGPDQQKTYEYLKEILTERTVLYFIDQTAPIYLAADASDKFIAGILYQVKSYTPEEIPALLESLKHTKELHKLPPPKHPTVHPLLPKGSLGIPSPFTLTTEGINSPHNPININSLNENIEPELIECLDSKDKLHVVCNVGYYSSSLSKSQAAYSIIEKEALAVVSSLEFFKPQLQGASKVYVLSDSRPFLYIMKLMRCGISRLQRWSIRLFSLPYEIIMVHIKGCCNVADSLTRVWAVEDDDCEKPDMKEAIIVTSPFKLGQLITYEDILQVLEEKPNLVSYKVKEKVKSKSKTTKPTPVMIKNVKINYIGTSIVSELEKMLTLAEISNAQLTDSFCKNIPKLKTKDEYYQFQNIWYKKRKNQTDFENSDGRIVVPRALVSPVIALFHMENHSGVTNICSHINSVYFFPHMFKTVREFLNMCHLCAVYKASTAPRTPINLREIDPPP